MGLIFKNGIPYAGVPEEIDAATVGGHTVEADVPADAAFTDNSDITAEGNPVILKDLQGGVPFSEIIVKGENISGQEMTLTATGKNQLPITVTSGTGAGVTYTVDNDEITVSGTTTGVSTITVSAPNMTITQDMRLSYRGNLSGMTPKATVLRNGETVYPTPNDTTGSKLLAGDVLQNVYIQQQNADVAVSGSAKFQLEYGTEVTEYEKYSSEVCTFTPDSVDYIIPTDIIQKDGVNILVVIGVDGATLSTTGVKADKAIEKLWQRDANDITCTSYETIGALVMPITTSIQENIDSTRSKISTMETQVNKIGINTTSYDYESGMIMGGDSKYNIQSAVNILSGISNSLISGQQNLKSKLNENTTFLENKLDKDGNVEMLKYSKIDFHNFAMSTENNPQLNETYKGSVLDITTISGASDLGAVTCIKKIDDVIYIGAENGFGYLNDAMTIYTPICSYAGLRATDIVVASRNPLKEITGWAIARMGQKPCYYEVENDSVIEINVDTFSLGYTFFPTRIYADYSWDNENPTLFFIDNNMTNKIGITRGRENNITMNYDFNLLESTVTDICIIDKYTTALIAYGNKILFRQDEGTFEEWHDLTDGIIVTIPPWGDGSDITIQKLYYEETTNEVYIFTSSGMELTLFKVDLGTMLNYPGWVEEEFYEVENISYLPFQELSTNFLVFGYNSNCYFLSGHIYALTDDNNYEYGDVSSLNLSFNYPKERAFSPVWIYNKLHNAFYIVTGNAGHIKLLKLEYDKEDELVNDTLNTYLIDIDLLKQKIAEQEAMIKNFEERLANAGL